MGLRGGTGLRRAQKAALRWPSPHSGTIHCVFHASGNHYTWKKVTTTVHNIIVGKLWIDQVGCWAVPSLLGLPYSSGGRRGGGGGGGGGKEERGGAERISAVSVAVG